MQELQTAQVSKAYDAKRLMDELMIQIISDYLLSSWWGVRVPRRCTSQASWWSILTRELRMLLLLMRRRPTQSVGLQFPVHVTLHATRGC